MPHKIFAANIFCRLLRLVPNLIRNWLEKFADTTKVLHTFVEKYISPILIARESSRLLRYKSGKSDSQLNFCNQKSSTTHAIIAFYKIEDFSMKLKLSIPRSYPLRPVKVEGLEKVGISETKWRTLVLASQSLLSTQNYNILDALLLWKENIDKSFEGIEPCSICYCILHPSDRTLPTPKCKTCSNKFHSSCLYKWFKTGGQSSCPMCRSLF